MTEYYLPDIPRLYTALAEWMACLIFILPFKKRFSPAVTGCLVAGAFGIQSVFLISTGGVRLILDPLYDICGFSDGCFCFLLL